MSKRYSVTVNGTVYEVEVEELGEGISAPVAPAAAPAPVAPAASTPAAPKAAAPAPAPKAAPAAAGAGTPVSAPMQGTILKVAVQNGQAIKKGDLICLLEAMKMENEIFAPCDGTVTSVPISAGQTVATGAVLATIA
ncbi:MAG: acetyl-CoA carboxylase biotin carboxyl carrier protein subunit [Clostridia bacterium]|nr:acetyl-CoA carboxylase biotin carboxyl carrier protein subunit [Clostridia bacterium]